jgi:hypothetical protein
MEVAQEILDSLGIGSVEEMDVNQRHEIESPRSGLMDLTIEKVGENRLSVAHYYTQRGDLMSDPEIVFRIDGGVWIPVRFTQHLRVHKHDPEGLELDSFQEQWNENLRDQGFVDAAHSRRRDH